MNLFARRCIRVSAVALVRIQVYFEARTDAQIGAKESARENVVIRRMGKGVTMLAGLHLR